MCRLQLFWHAGAVEQYKDRYFALSNQFQNVEVLVPDGWKEVPSDCPLRCSADGVTIRRIGAWLPYHPFLILLQTPGAHVDRFQPDLIYVHEEPQSITAFQLAREAVSRDIPFFVDSAVINRRLHFGGFNPCERYVYRHAELVYYRNDLCRQTLLERGCPRAKLRGPLPNGVSRRTFHPAPPDAVSNFRSRVRTEASASDAPVADSTFVGFAGRIAQRKGMDLLLELARQRPATVVLFCGRVEESRYVDRIEEMPNAAYLGLLEPDALARFYSACDLLALPSIPTESWEEQFGRVLTESIMCGTPALGSDVGMVAEIVGDDAVFPPGNTEKFIEVIDRYADDDVRVGLYRKQKQRVDEKYTWEVVAEKVRWDAERALRRLDA